MSKMSVMRIVSVDPGNPATITVERQCAYIAGASVAFSSQGETTYTLRAVGSAGTSGKNRWGDIDLEYTVYANGGVKIATAGGQVYVGEGDLVFFPGCPPDAGSVPTFSHTSATPPGPVPAPGSKPGSPGSTPGGSRRLPDGPASAERADRVGVITSPKDRAERVRDAQAEIEAQQANEYEEKR
jgi:hypothetical protein